MRRDAASGTGYCRYSGAHATPEFAIQELRSLPDPGAPQRARWSCAGRRPKPSSPTRYLLDTREDQDFTHSDPWRVLRIQSEFVEGFGALAGLGPAISVFGSARTPRGSERYIQAEKIGGLIAAAGRGSDNRWRTRGHGGGKQGRRARPAGSRLGWASSFLSRPGSTNGWTWASTSGTSLRERRCSSSTRRDLSSCPAATEPWMNFSRR